MNRVSVVEDRVPIQRILISVSDKSRLDSLVTTLVEIPEVTIYSTGGTYQRIGEILGNRAAGILKRVSDYTGQPEMQGGLVKTLDYRIYLGLLSEPFNKDHEDDRKRAGAHLIDMVVSNLYPFREVTARTDSDREDARSNIDIGGPCMIRAAAKSYLRVASVCDPVDYSAIEEELRSTGWTLGFSTRFALARKAFAHTALYDAAIAAYFEELEGPASGPYTME